MPENKRTVLISGASKGIGFASAQKCMAEGCRVILVARDREGLLDAQKRLVKAGHNPEDIHLHAADLMDLAGTADWIARLPWIEKGLWGLVTNAAVEILKNVADYTDADMMQMLKVNILSPIKLIQACHPHLKTTQGNIVYVGSVADHRRTARYSFYGGTKAFMKSFVGHAGQELGFDGIRINLVSPGATNTELMRDMRAAGTWPEEELRDFEASIPIEQRIARPEEIADAIWFALSGPSYFHGEDLRIYGGHR